MAETLKGLARAQEIYNYRSRRAREIKQAGRKVLGYFCCYPPEASISQTKQDRIVTRLDKPH
jgi:hypothetical protein